MLKTSWHGYRLQFIVWAVIAVAAIGCSRTQYRMRADADAYHVIAERNGDPRWQTDNPSIDIDPRSRFFDPLSIDCPPMPADDPTSQAYMQCVNGMQGWERWSQNGVRDQLENPIWRETVSEYSHVNDDGVVQLDIDSALQLAYLHSPLHQNQLETLYLTALDVSAERFRLDTQYFGGYDVTYSHDGSLVPAQLAFDNTSNRFVVTRPFQADALETNRFTFGRGSGADPLLQAQRRFASAGQLLAGFANSFVFEFTGADANLTASLLNFSFIQPLLRGAGRDIALEDLTAAERRLLANLRSYAQFRQGFYTQLAIGELGVQQVQRGGGGTALQSFSGQGGLGGYLGLLQQLQQIRNIRNNLALQRRTLARLDAILEFGGINLIQVEQFKQQIKIEQDSLLRAQVSYELALDRFKSSSLGLPPDLEIRIDDDLIQQFQLVSQDSAEIQDQLLALLARTGQLNDEPSDADLSEPLATAERILESIRQQFVSVETDLSVMSNAVEERRVEMSPEQLVEIDEEQQNLATFLQDRIGDLEKLATKYAKLELREPNGDSRRSKLITWITEAQQLVQRTSLVQARARLEQITVPPVNLNSTDAQQIALANRLDFMNGRAALVDNWRQIQIAADALQSVLNITANGELRTARNNPVSFRAPTANAQIGVEFDAPLTRLFERNAYRETLINYQRNRRTLIQSRDGLSLGLRQLLRQLEQLRKSLDIQRQAVAIAILRVDLTTTQLSAPKPPQQLGQLPRLDSTTAFNLLSAQASLLQSQNAFLGVWLNYLATRVRLYRELGIMKLDPDGVWVEYPLPSDSTLPREAFNPTSDNAPIPTPDSDTNQLPPELPKDYIDLLNEFPQSKTESATQQVSFQQAKSPRVRRLAVLPGERPE